MTRSVPSMSGTLRILPLFDLAPGGVYHAVSVTENAVRSYRTLSPLLAGMAHERFAFCGTFPGVAPAGRYPAPCFRGARTFLSAISHHSATGAAIRPTDTCTNVRSQGSDVKATRDIRLYEKPETMTARTPSLRNRGAKYGRHDPIMGSWRLTG